MGANEKNNRELTNDMEEKIIAAKVAKANALLKGVDLSPLRSHRARLAKSR